MTVTAENQTIMLEPGERQVIEEFITEHGGDAQEFATADGRGLPAPVNGIFRAVLRAIKEDLPISVSTLPREVTTTTAASMLGMSRPTLMKHVREGRIAAHKVGSHHRLLSRDVLAYRDALKQDRLQAVFDVMDFDDEVKSEN